ncbi:hypothetical protein BJX99DRAFT_256058 [Aspergillus californicus]
MHRSSTTSSRPTASTLHPCILATIQPLDSTKQQMDLLPRDQHLARNCDGENCKSDSERTTQIVLYTILITASLVIILVTWCCVYTPVYDFWIWPWRGLRRYRIHQELRVRTAVQDRVRQHQGHEMHQLPRIEPPAILGVVVTGEDEWPWSITWLDRYEYEVEQLPRFPREPRHGCGDHCSWRENKISYIVTFCILGFLPVFGLIYYGIPWILNRAGYGLSRAYSRRRQQQEAFAAVFAAPRVQQQEQVIEMENGARSVSPTSPEPAVIRGDTGRISGVGRRSFGTEELPYYESPSASSKHPRDEERGDITGWIFSGIACVIGLALVIFALVVCFGPALENLYDGVYLMVSGYRWKRQQRRADARAAAQSGAREQIIEIEEVARAVPPTLPEPAVLRGYVLSMSGSSENEELPSYERPPNYTMYSIDEKTGC